MQPQRRRSFWVFWCLGVLFGALALKLGVVQILCGRRLAQAAVEQRAWAFALEIPRGQIFDRNLIALTDPRTRLDVRDAKQVLVSTRYGPRSVARHVVGHLTDFDTTGAYGIEQRFDTYGKTIGLRGETPSTLQIPLDGKGKPVAGLGFGRTQASARASVVLTLDIRVQRAVEEALDSAGVQKGAVIVLQSKTADVLAMASRPQFDQNDVGDSALDPDSPFLNRALEPFFPGSVFKTIVAATALESGFINAGDEFFCPGPEAVPTSSYMGCIVHASPTFLSAEEAMVQSCNPVFVEIGSRVGAEAIRACAYRMGIGRDWSELPEGKPGFIRVPDSARALAHLSIGQEYVKVTPLEMTAAFACIANLGVYREPRLVRYLLDKDGRVLADFPLGTAQRALGVGVATTLQKWLGAVVDSGTGSRANVPQYGAAGKTGTPEGAGSKSENPIYDAWFVGWTPRKNPQYVIGVFLEGGGSGPMRAAPLFADIAIALTKLENDI